MNKEEWMQAMREGWEHMKPFIVETIEREVAMRVHAMKMDILTDTVGDEVRRVLQQHVREHLVVHLEVNGGE